MLNSFPRKRKVHRQPRAHPTKVTVSLALGLLSNTLLPLHHGQSRSDGRNRVSARERMVCKKQLNFSGRWSDKSQTQLSNIPFV